MTWDTALGYALGVASTVAFWFIARIGKVANRRTEAAIDRSWGRGRIWLAQKKKQREQEKAAKKEAREIQRLRSERIGRVFRRRLSADDPGMIGKIVDLYERDPKSTVVVIWTSPPGRDPTEADPPAGERSGIAWRYLHESAAVQKHRTARMNLKSDNDEDGWVEFEEIKPPD